MTGVAMITREQLTEWAIQNGWELDRFGHLQKVEHEGLRHYRLKLSRIAVRSRLNRTPVGCEFGAATSRTLQSPPAGNSPV